MILELVLYFILGYFLGRVIGENVEVKGGLSGVASIVESVRGIDLGEKVEIR